MRVLIASDKFKHSLSSEEVASHLTKGLLVGQPDLLVDSLPIADGGEGAVNAPVSAVFQTHAITVSGLRANPPKHSWPMEAQAS